MKITAKLCNPTASSGVTGFQDAFAVFRTDTSGTPLPTFPTQEFKTQQSMLPRNSESHQYRQFMI